jgi:BirA family biotin operon repressor/biotin-[acetyl-CoA-carboxylase] ligase
LVAALIREFVRLFTIFGEHGLPPFIEEWHRYHAFEDQPVRLVGASDELQGVVCGLDASGALMLRTASGEVVSAHSGEVSLRAN